VDKKRIELSRCRGRAASDTERPRLQPNDQELKTRCNLLLMVWMLQKNGYCFDSNAMEFQMLKLAAFG
jgi:hypothetical protein